MAINSPGKKPQQQAQAVKEFPMHEVPAQETTAPEAAAPEVPAQEPAEQESAEHVPARVSTTQMIQLTLGLSAEEPAELYRQRRIDMTLDPHQARVMRRIVNHLDRTGAVLKSGARVINPGMAVRWLLEAIEDVAG